LAGYGRPLEFDPAQIRNLRASPPVFLREGRGRPLSEGTVAFDYGGRTYRIGSLLEEAEAKLVVVAIRKRFPNLGEHKGETQADVQDSVA
jgi:hypothetical protein